MLGAFVVLVHVPSLVIPQRWAPTPHAQWTELLLAVTIAGESAVMAEAHVPG